MQKIINKWWILMVGVILVGIYVYGYANMFFHQDDLDWFILANRPVWEVMGAPIGDHVNYMWRLLLKAEWELFGFNYSPYLMVSVVMHAMVIWLLYLIAKATSGRRDLAIVVACLFSLNTNWTESVLWISGQTILITALGVLLAMYGLWKKRGGASLLFLASWTSALSLGLIVATGVMYKSKRWSVVLILLILGLIYRQMGGDGTQIEMSMKWALHVVAVSGLMIVNTVVGRTLIPFDRWELARIVMVGGIMAYSAWKWRAKLGGIWRDNWSRFLIIQLSLYSLIVAIGRAQYGIGIMRAERYSYLGLALLLLLAVRVLRNWQLGRWILVVPIVLVLQIGGFYVRVNHYVQRPQQLRALVTQMEEGQSEQMDPDAYLPHFVLNDARLKYRDLWGLMRD